MTAAWDDAAAVPTLAALIDVVLIPDADNVEAARQALATVDGWALVARLPWALSEDVRAARGAVESYDANARRGA